MRKKILIVLNAVVYNRGSEALVRGLTKICKNELKDTEIYLSSSELNFGEWINIPYVDRYIKKYSFSNPKSIKRNLAIALRKILKLRKISNKIIYKDFIKVAKQMDLIIVIGADNYDKSYGMFESLHNMNLLLKEETNAKLVMYDCSLQNEDIDINVVEDFKLFDVVTARESITFDNFNKLLKNNIIKYYPDPAFIMQAQETVLPVGWIEEKMIGINLSSLVTDSRYGTGYNMIMDSYYSLIDYIINETDNNIVFIPHVMQNKDLSVLTQLYEKYKDTGRVIIIKNEKLNAAQLKYIISKCRLYVGARTHSTIAAYSSCIPTLVLGYSIKSIGIARDIFGTEKKYVVSVSDVNNRYELRDSFKWILENEYSIKKHLKEFMPEYIEKAQKTSEVFKYLMEE